MAAAQHRGSITFMGRTGIGARALDTYHFSYEIAGDGSVRPHQLTGTIVMHDRSNLIAAITMQTTVTGADPQLADSEPLTFTTVMTFSDYGLPVSVQAPAGAQRIPQKLAPPPSPGA